MAEPPRNMLNDSDRRCSREEFEHVRLFLLSRAPADRAWRRRSSLVLLRSHASKAREESHDEGGTSGDVSGINVVDVVV